MSLTVHQVSKKYEAHLAVDSVSFNIQPGEIVGFLGPNGAGKSTTLKMIAGFLPPDQGVITLNDCSIEKEPTAYKKRIGYLPESNPLYLDMYVKEYFHFLAEVHQLPNPNNRIQEVIGEVGLTFMQSKKIGELSKGYQQRVGIGAAILHQPALLLLDEPTSGLDPNQLIEIRQLIQSLSSKSMILFSTHILHEVTAICSRVLVLHQGKLVANEPIENLLKTSQNKVTVIFEQTIDTYLPELKALGFQIELVDKHTLVAEANDTNLLKNKLMSFALAKGLNIQSLQSQHASLEEIFKLLTH
ncbi:MAG: ATP-binding cassette domain-containing protein [Chitinophagaceae bacterium]|nr:MAG: ATP-binding cassette domain-containing protein [Chitinophagaceae bacterium]